MKSPLYISLFSLLVLSKLQADIVSPELKSMGEFYHISGLKDSKKTEDIFVLKNSIIGARLNQEKRQNRMVWIADFTTTELESAAGCGSSNKKFSLVFFSRDTALKFLTQLLTVEVE